MSGRGRGAGFTLVELLVATSILGVVFTAVFALLAGAVRQQASVLGRSMLDSEASLVSHAIAVACASASYIETPPAGTASVSALRVWENVDPADGVSELVAGSPRRYSHFCRSPEGTLVLYRGGYPAPAITCGADAAGAERLGLTGSVPGETISPTFAHSAANELVVSFTLAAPETFTRQPLSRTLETTVDLQGPLE